MNTIINRDTSRTILKLAGLAAAAVIWLAAAPAHAQSTTVTTAGDNFTANLASGTNATLKLGTITVNCNTSTTSGGVPAAPNNHSANPPGVTTPTTAPTFKNGTSATCPSNLFGAPVSIVSSGSWSIKLQNGSPISGTLVIPQNGVVATANILGNSCKATVAPTGPFNLTGTWTNGSGTTKPRLVITNQTVPVASSGGGVCPTGTTAVISATYEVGDTTSPTLLINVGP